MNQRLVIALLTVSLLAGCTVGPKYHRPSVTTPDVFRGTADPNAPPDAHSLADLKWFEVFKDTQLQDLINTAFKQNYDIREAVARVSVFRAQLDIANRTLATRQNSLDLIKVRQQGGVATMLEVRQAEQLVYTAAQAVPDVERQIEQTESQISFLIGKNPGAVTRGRALSDQEQPPSVPPGLPSSLLERRPDITAAEQNLIAANPDIAVAKAAYFPTISLTGFLGTQSNHQPSLFTNPPRNRPFVPRMTQP